MAISAMTAASDVLKASTATGDPDATSAVHCLSSTRSTLPLPEPMLLLPLPVLLLLLAGQWASAASAIDSSAYFSGMSDADEVSAGDAGASAA